MVFKNVLIIGSSRGMGCSLARFAGIFQKGFSLDLVSRNESALFEVARSIQEPPPPFSASDYYSPYVETHAADMTKPEGVKKVEALVSDKRHDLIVYCAGGGPYGAFVDKEWKDHEWALNLNLFSPARLIHHWLKVRPANSQGRFVFVGSRIAEFQPDPQSSSYAAGKHGMKGMISSLQAELEASTNKVYLFSPGYMNTSMLPPNASVRHDGSKLFHPDTAAQVLFRWLEKDGPWHRVL